MTDFAPWRWGELQPVTFPSGGWPVSGVVWAGRWVLGLSSGGIVHSKDGVTWSAEAFPLGAGNRMDSLTNGQGRLLAACTSSRFLTSTMDLTAWTTPVAPLTTTGANRVRYLAGRFFAVGGFHRVYSSRDGVTWAGGETGPKISGVWGSHQDIAWNGRCFVVVGSLGRVYVSRELETWERASMPGATDVTGPLVYCCAFGAGRFVAGSGDGKFYHSTDGLTWETAPAPSGWPAQYPPSIYDIAFVDGRFLAACSLGYFAASSDGLTWEGVRDGQTTEASPVLLGRGLRVLRAGSYGPAGTNPALRLGTINPWPATLPAPMQRTVSTTRMDTRLRRETQSGRIEVRRFGSGAPAQADVTFRCLGNQATALLTFHRDACRNGARWFTAPWLPLLGFPAHAARFFTPPQRAGRGDLYSDYTTTLLVRGIEEVL